MVKGWHVKYYDPIGNRVSRIYNGAETRYVVDPASVVLAETDDQGNITAYYVYGLGLISKVTPAGDAYYYHHDGLGSTVAINNSSENIVNKYAYGIFGQIIEEQEQVDNPFKYVGAYGVMDEGNGNYFMRARYYDPETVRFISKDPIGLLGGINMYAYVGGNPLNWIDPEGLLGPTILFGRPWFYIRPGLRPSVLRPARGIPEQEWWEWSEYNVPPHLYPKPKPHIPWYLKPMPDWKPEPPHFRPPEESDDPCKEILPWIA